jgi:4-hydroxy-tetrahydrodipicolinate reductase
MSVTRVGIAGCCGRMGRALVRLAHADPQLQLTQAFCGPNDQQAGRDVGSVAGIGDIGVTITRCESPGCTDAACDVLVEFTNPASARGWAEWCRARKLPLVSGTTGLAESEQAAHRALSEVAPVVWSPNMSVGVNLLLTLVEQASRVLGRDWDCEISEVHHRHKADAPSGTARALLRSVCAGRGDDPAKVTVYGREGLGGGRQPGLIGVHALRMGEVVGDHDVHFAGAAEVLTLSLRALSRDTFAAGALVAARWVRGQRAGLYSMQDVLRA